jgi:hypothetical protein
MSRYGIRQVAAQSYGGSQETRMIIDDAIQARVDPVTLLREE